MAVEEAHDAQEARVTPADAPADPEAAPASDDAREGANVGADSGEVHDSEAATRSREAAGYRVKLRAAEATIVERDGVIGALRARLDDVDRAEVERLAATSLDSPADLWLVTDLADLRADDGTLDAEKVKARVDAVAKERPSWRVRGTGFDGGARRTATPARTPGLSDLLKSGKP